MSDSLPTMQEFQCQKQEQMIESYNMALKYINELHVQIEQLEKSAVDLIVEKDQIIQELELQLQHSSRRPSFNNYEEVTQYKNHIADLQQRLEQLQIKHYDQLQEQEKMWNQYLLDQISQNQQTVDQKLKSHLDQIFHLEDKINKLENDLEIKENQQITYINKIKQIQELNAKLEDEQMQLNRQLLKVQIEIEQQQSLNVKEKNSLLEEFNNQTKELTSLQEQVQNYKQQNSKLNNQNKIYQSTISELMLKKSELEQVVSSSQKQENLMTAFNFLKTATHTVEQINEGYYEISTTAFDLNEETTDMKQELISFQIEDNNKCNQSHISNKSENQYQSKFTELEKCIQKSNLVIKQQNAQLQLLNQQLQLLRKQNMNGLNARQYLNQMELTYNQSLQLKKEQLESLEKKVVHLEQENLYLKQKVKQYSQKLISITKKQKSQ